MQPSLPPGRPIAIPAELAEVLREVEDWSQVQLVAADDRFLGTLQMEATDPRSIFNPEGPHGGDAGAASIWNPSGAYGGVEGPLSPFNPTCPRPPRLQVGGATVCMVSANTTLATALRIHPDALPDLTRLRRRR